MTRSSPSPVRLPVHVGAAAAAVLALLLGAGPGGRFAGTAAADSTDVILNEITTWSPQTVEVVNTGPDSVDLNGFRLEGEAGLLFEFTSKILLPPDSVLAIPLPGPDTLRITGDAVGWLDGFVPIDRVSFGDHGGAPVPVGRTPFSLARAGGGPMDPDPALTWTVDPDGTLGAGNDAPPPDLAGDGVVMNEWSFPLAGPREIELFNASMQTVDVGGYMLTNDLNRVLLTPLAPIPPGGFNLPSSGGEGTSNHQTRYPSPPSPGMPNPPPATAAEPSAWGGVKARFRR